MTSGSVKPKSVHATLPPRAPFPLYLVGGGGGYITYVIASSGALSAPSLETLESERNNSFLDCTW